MNVANRAKLKPKINTLGKSHPIENSAFYKLTSKNVLYKLLGVPKEEVIRLLVDPDRYNEFQDLTNIDKPRAIQKPKKALDVVQSRIASLICRIEVPEYLESGRKGRSHVTNAIAHVSPNNTSVAFLTTDIRSFFPSTTVVMVYNFFRSTLRCSHAISDILSNLCTCRGFVPTGSRISMPIAFWANYPMFLELDKLCEKHNIRMSVYVDDLTFSGNNINTLFLACVRKIIIRHGHEPHPDKTKLYARNDVKIVTGVAVVDNSITATNKQHLKLYQEIEAWKAIKDIPDALETNTVKRLIGRLNSLTLIDYRFKDKARSIKSATS